MAKKKDKDINPAVKVEVTITGEWPTVEKKNSKKKKKRKSNKPMNNQKQSQCIRKAPRASRSASARRWKDLRTSDGKQSKVTTYKLDQDGNIIEKK